MAPLERQCIPFLEPLPKFKPHAFRECRGNCRQHPLVVGSVAHTIALMSKGFTWGDIVYYELEERKKK